MDYCAWFSKQKNIWPLEIVIHVISTAAIEKKYRRITEVAYEWKESAKNEIAWILDSR